MVAAGSLFVTPPTFLDEIFVGIHRSSEVRRDHRRGVHLLDDRGAGNRIAGTEATAFVDRAVHVAIRFVEVDTAYRGSRRWTDARRGFCGIVFDPFHGEPRLNT